MTCDALRVADYLDHILDAIRRIDEYTTDVDEMGFLGNTMIEDAATDGRRHSP